jgi:hypothetical protein
MAKRLLGYYANTYYAEHTNGTYGIAFMDRGQWIFIGEEEGTIHQVSVNDIVLGGLVTLSN